MENGEGRSLGAYLGEIHDSELSDDERFERSMDRMFARLDAQIAAGEAGKN